MIHIHYVLASLLSIQLCGIRNRLFHYLIQKMMSNITPTQTYIDSLKKHMMASPSLINNNLQMQ